MKAEDLLSAFDGIDADLLYDARFKRTEKLTVIRRAAIAAAVVIFLLSSIAFYANIAMPFVTVSLSTKEDLAFSCNLRGKVLRISSDNPHFQQAVGKDLTDAVKDAVTLMADDRSLSESENTILIASDEKTRDRVTDAVREALQRVDFSCHIISVLTDQTDNNPTQPSLSAARAALTDILIDRSDSFSRDSLKVLSINDLGLLIRDLSVTDERVKRFGEPSENRYIGKERALEIAREISVITDDRADVNVRLSVYHHQMIYLVTRSVGDRAEAYFINAVSGEKEHAVKSATIELPQIITQQIRDSNILSSSENNPVSSDLSHNTQENPAGHNDIEDIKTNETSHADDPYSETQPVRSISYEQHPISMMELSFVTMTPPSSAKEISFHPLFEGQFIEARTGEKNNEGTISVITDTATLEDYLNDHGYAYLDESSESFYGTLPQDYFDTRFLIVSACTFSDASYYTTLSKLYADSDTLYLDDTLSYSKQREGAYYCRTLSVYEVTRENASPSMTIKVY